ncbi:MAG: hypothetical protein GEU80_16080 [Dehalococcoidia bacterium]|nr:hypothetical protein [Dehalococcoidia bacterium]
MMHSLEGLERVHSHGISSWSRAALSRRRLLRSAGVAGAGLAGAALIGCGGDDDPEPSGTTAPGTGTAAAGGSPGASATGAASPAASGEPKRGGTYRSFTSGDPPTLDPYGNASTGTKTFAAYVYSRLFQIETAPDVQSYAALPGPDLAESGETDDGQHWTVKLRPGVKFHNVDPVNGREVTAEDVLFSWQRVSAPESHTAGQVAHFADVQAVDDSTLSFALSAPSPTFLETLADSNLLWVMPTESDGGFNPQEKAIGSGPWVLDNYSIASQLNFKAHPDYYNADLPYMDGADLFIIPEYANQIAQFRAGNLHTATVNFDDVPDVNADLSGVQWSAEPSNALVFIYFSPEDMEPDAPWRDERFRRAVSMSLDRAGLAALGTNREGLLAVGLEPHVEWNNIIPAAFGDRWWLDPLGESHGPSAANFEYQPDEARKLVEAVGTQGSIPYVYTNNRYGVRFGLFAEALHQFMTDIGLELETQVQDYNSQYITQTFLGNFKGIAFGASTPFPEVGGYVERFFGEGETNHGRVHDPEITSLHEQQRVELDEPARREHIHNIQRRNADQMFYVPAQGSAGAGWVGFHPALRDLRRTRAYGGATESIAHYWLDA